jgi:UDP-GlcNAc:undecaprenyl-phosphate/decaprenyl-phosphate GlcNAc-1-phosphate transferase
MIWMFTTAVALAALLTWGVRLLMLRLSVVDAPEGGRKIHKKPIALGGGLAIFLTCSTLMLILLQQGKLGADISPKIIIGCVIAGAVLMIGGFLDDKHRWKPKKQLIAPIIAAGIILTAGLGLESVTNPTGGLLALNQIRFTLEGLGNLVLFADTVVFFWLMGMMFTTKFLDGLDGLVAGTAAIGGLMMFFVARQPQWFQPEVAMVSLIFAGACAGFLVWNFHPAKIFLGEGGSVYTGFMLGVLALISGSKIATTLLVMGVPILDVARVIVTRKMKGKSIFEGDDEHLHYKLLHSGLSQKQTVYIFYGISALFGMSTLYLQSKEKLMALILLGIMMLFVGVWFSKHPYEQAK